MRSSRGADLRRLHCQAPGGQPWCASSTGERAVTDPKPPIVCVGEVTLELARGGDGRFTLGCSGDTFNTAVYLARAGIPVSYASAIGDDRYSDGILAMAAAEGVSTDLVLRVPGRVPGLSLVEAVGAGE